MNVWIRPETHRDATTTAFGAGATLHTGDRFAIKVWVDQPARVWVVSCSADKRLTLLYTSGASPLTASAEARIPREDDAWFQLDTKTGTETLYVVASQGALANADPDVARTIERLANGDLVCEPDGPREPAPALAPTPAPAASSAPPAAPAKPIATPAHGLALPARKSDDIYLIASRGVKIVSGGPDEGGRSLCQVGSGGFAVCKLWFKHD
jgi:hypothetical protein